MRIEIVQGSVLDQDVDAIVNAANTMMRGGGGIDGAIHAAAGPGLLDELQRVAENGCPTGQVVVTSAHKLKQRYIFHTPGPVWRGGHHGEPELLASCYRNSLIAADKLGLKSIGFCSISTGVYGYPLPQASEIALRTVLAYRESSLDRALFSLFRAPEYKAFQQALVRFS